MLKTEQVLTPSFSLFKDRKKKNKDFTVLFFLLNEELLQAFGLPKEISLQTKL